MEETVNEIKNHDKLFKMFKKSKLNKYIGKPKDPWKQSYP